MFSSESIKNHLRKIFQIEFLKNKNFKSASGKYMMFLDDRLMIDRTILYIIVTNKYSIITKILSFFKMIGLI